MRDSFGTGFDKVMGMIIMFGLFLCKGDMVRFWNSLIKLFNCVSYLLEEKVRQI